jgi:hypothetical protein
VFVEYEGERESIAPELRPERVALGWPMAALEAPIPVLEAPEGGSAADAVSVVCPDADDESTVVPAPDVGVGDVKEKVDKTCCPLAASAVGVGVDIRLSAGADGDGAAGGVKSSAVSSRPSGVSKSDMVCFVAAVGLNTDGVPRRGSVIVGTEPSASMASAADPNPVACCGDGGDGRSDDVEGNRSKMSRVG